MVGILDTAPTLASTTATVFGAINRVITPATAPTAQTPLAALAIDSLDRVELAMEIEQRLNVEIDDTAWAQLFDKADATVADIAAHVQSLRTGGAA